MIIGLLIVQLVLCAFILYREAVVRQFANLASSLFFLVFLVVLVVEPLVLHIFFGGARSITGGLYANYFPDPVVYYISSAYGIILLISFLLIPQTSGSGSKSLIAEGDAQTAIHDGRSEAHFIAALIILGVVLFVASTGLSLQELLVASRFAWYDEVGFSLLWLTVSSYFVALIGVYAYLLKTAPPQNRIIVAACITAIVLHAIVTKDRKWILFLTSGWVAGLYETSGRRLLLKRRVIAPLAALFVILYLSQFLRDALFRLALGEQLDFLAEFIRWQEILVTFGDISYFYRASLEAIHQNIANGVILPLALLRRVVFFFLPVSWSFGLKVEDISATFSDIVDGGDAQRRGNMPPGMFGLAVLSFGWFVTLWITPLVAALLHKLDGVFVRGSGKLRQAVLSLYLFAVLLTFRGDDSSAFYYIISTFLALSGWGMFKLLFTASPQPAGSVKSTDRS